MRWVIILFLLVISRQAVYAQADSIHVWNKWCAKADTPLLFATANNVLCVYSKSIKPANLIVKSMDNALKISAPEIKGDTMCFMAMPYPKLGKKMRLTISDRNTRKVLRTVSFNSEEPPKPVARIGKINGTDIPKKDLAAQKALQVTFAGSMYCYPYVVKQYTLKTRIAGKDLVAQVKGPLFDKEVQRIIDLAPVGTFLLFTDIKATCAECGDRDLPELRIWVR